MKYLGNWIVGMSVTLTLGAPAMAERVDASWQNSRDIYNAMSDKTCTGDRISYIELYSADINNQNAVAKNDFTWLIENYLEGVCDLYVENSDLDGAIGLQRQSADADHAVAMNGFANRLLQGNGVPQDTDASLEYFWGAIALNYGSAAVDLANYYLEGKHVARDYREAVHLLKRAREDAGPKNERPSAESIAALSDSLDNLDPRDAGYSPGTQSSSWSVRGTTASWGVVKGARLASEVFVVADAKTGEISLGLRHISNDPLMHYMGVSVQMAGGKDQELPFGKCGSNNCLRTDTDDNQTSTATVSIPIDPSFQEAFLEVLKSGNTATFRYQTEDSLSVNSYIKKELSLKRSRIAIEQIERKAAAIARKYSRSSAATADTEPQTKRANSTVSSAPTTKYASSGNTYFHPKSQDGDIFFPARTLSGFPPSFYTELSQVMQDQYLNDPTKRIKLGNPEFVEKAGVTVWSGITGSGFVSLYGGKSALQFNVRTDGARIRFKGNWELTPTEGVVLYLRSVEPGFNVGYRHFECKGGTLATDTGYSGNVTFKTCHIAFQCADWFDDKGRRLDNVYFNSKNGHPKWLLQSL